MEDTKTKPITYEVFRKRYDELRPLIYGKADVIGRMAGSDGIRFKNAVWGNIKSHELLQPLYDAMEQVAKQEYKKFEL